MELSFFDCLCPQGKSLHHGPGAGAGNDIPAYRQRAGQEQEPLVCLPGLSQLGPPSSERAGVMVTRVPLSTARQAGVELLPSEWELGGGKSSRVSDLASQTRSWRE